MNKINHKVLFCITLVLTLISCYHEERLSVDVDFVVQVDHDKYTIPVRITLDNKTTGASYYQWSFEGGNPSNSNKRQPSAVVYSVPGTYTIRLEAWNDDERKSKDFILKVDSLVTIAFDIDIPINTISPVQAIITNKSKGGTSYSWKFENGNPATSDQFNPPVVTFTKPGDHMIALVISNGSEIYTHSETITVLPPMQLDFTITPSFENEDMQIPFTAFLENKSINGLNYQWISETGIITNDTELKETSIFFTTEGDHIITLKGDNGKEKQNISKTITLKPNTNLYVMNDVKLGIKSAHNSIGCFYSCNQRKVIKKDEVTEKNASLIDFAFFGINENFNYCRFLSPDSVDEHAFYEIPNALHTSIINTLENSQINFSAADFDKMVDDSPLKSLSIMDNKSNDSYFTSSVVPRIVLFETSDGRKGAIKIKSFVSNNLQSYITIDVKVQKEKK